MSAVLTSHYQSLPDVRELSKKKVAELSEFIEWVNLEIDKIQVSARLIGVHVAYMPNAEGRRLGLFERKGDVLGATCHVDAHPLMGMLWFHCDREVMEKKIRLPGINSEYANYSYNGQERTPDEVDDTGSVGFWHYGPHRYEIHHGTDRDIIQ
jgi:hypothetical protein